YTGIRIRGTDATRINVTLNGIPYNDAESQGTYFVDLPDFSSSVNTIQVQRGVGTSSNGAGAFGASINFSTNELNKDSYAEINNSFGSFNTWKNTIKVGSGLVGGHFTVDARLSRVSSDGYIDRASSDLHSFYFSTAYINKKSSLRFNIFKGKEKTYQAWNGVSEDMLKTDRTYNSCGTEKPGDPYSNETDNYWQDHYQLFYNQQIGKNFIFNTALFYTKGKGYYEEYKADQDYADYNLPYPVSGMDTIYTTDLVRQLWLNNNFYGNTFSLQYKHKNTQWSTGGAWTKYEGHHYGQVIWASHGLTGFNDWYYHTALKTDFNLYSKLQQNLSKYVTGFIDVQYRNVKYDIDGFRDNPDLFVKNNYHFFNPKIGLSYTKNGWNSYISYSIGNKEPNRDDFEAGVLQQPKPEKLNDLEFAIQKRRKSYTWGATFYYMQYKDQLVLTGKINDVGSYTRTNIPDSYRMGIEIEGSATPYSWLKLAGNLSLSRNKVKNFQEYIDDYDAGGQKVNQYNLTDIALSPGSIGSTTISFIPVKNLELALLSKYVSKQYLDNTQHEDRKLNAYYTQDVRAVVTFKKGLLKEANLVLQVNNIFNKLYEPSGYTYSYIYGGSLTTENYYYPMAGTNFMTALNLRF
ncbi:MAG: TonB-dependent receptor plug domain-containing protein, partial [Bacteroidetes bacterium]|nr:TonB-dependent receptor plug domain-containing protein [Bacteroidota bacterium]